MPKVTPSKPARILVIEDSALILEALVELYQEDPRLEVIGTATTGTQGIELACTLKPDLISLDLLLPDLNGFEVIEQVMALAPTPIYVVTVSLSPQGLPPAHHALSLGAIDVTEKPSAAELYDPCWRARFCEQLYYVSQVPVIPHVRNKKARLRSQGRASFDSMAPPITTPRRRAASTNPLLVIGGSTGAPRTLRTLLPRLCEGRPLPGSVLIAIHLGEPMTHEFLRYLQGITPCPIQLLEDDLALQPNRLYLVPGGIHAELTSPTTVRLLHDLPRHTYRPSLDHLLHSVATTCGANAAGILLSGMGRDGAEGLLTLRNAGGLTLAQDEASCVIFGIPRAAHACGATQQLLPPAQLARAALQWMKADAPLASGPQA